MYELYFKRLTNNAFANETSLLTLTIWLYWHFFTMPRVSLWAEKSVKASNSHIITVRHLKVIKSLSNLIFAWFVSISVSMLFSSVHFASLASTRTNVKKHFNIHLTPDTILDTFDAKMASEADWITYLGNIDINIIEYCKIYCHTDKNNTTLAYELIVQLKAWKIVGYDIDLT